MDNNNEVIEKLYDVVQYFDDVYERTVETGLTREEAEKKAYEWYDKEPRHYVSFGVRPEGKKY